MGAYTSSVSCAMRLRFSGGRYCSVRMLCSRSASLTMTTRMSSTIARTILRTFSACASSFETLPRLLILVTPSTRCATSGPKYLLMSSGVVRVSSTTSCRRPVLTVTTSIFISARMPATESGWMRYGSPDLRT
jgi:hypothetical protein